MIYVKLDYAFWLSIVLNTDTHKPEFPVVAEVVFVSGEVAHLMRPQPLLESKTLTFGGMFHIMP